LPSKIYYRKGRSCQWEVRLELLEKWGGALIFWRIGMTDCWKSGIMGLWIGITLIEVGGASACAGLEA
jgi:hypothetical protein